MSTTYNVTAERGTGGDVWVLQCVEFPGAISQTRSLRNARELMKEAIGFVAEVDQDDVEIELRMTQDSAPPGGLRCLMADPGWLTTSEAAAVLDVSPATVLRLGRLGSLEVRRPGLHGYEFSRPSVVALAAERASWLSHERASELVGIAPRVITRAVARGELHPRDVDHSVPSLSRDEVLAWAGARRRRQAERDRHQQELLERTRPPQDGRVWLDVETVAIMLRISPGRVRQLLRADRLPYTRRGRRYWFLREHIEQISAARALHGG